MARAKATIRSVMADARGSCRTVGDLICFAATERAMGCADALARREAFSSMLDHFGWKRGSYLTKQMLSGI